MTEIQRIKIARNNVPHRYEEHEKTAAAPTEEVSQAVNNEDESGLGIRHLAGPIRKRAKKNTDHALMPKSNVNINATVGTKTRRQSKAAAAVYDENENDENTMNISAG